jgi:hypothetical protein
VCVVTAAALVSNPHTRTHHQTLACDPWSHHLFSKSSLPIRQDFIDTWQTMECEQQIEPMLPDMEWCQPGSVADADRRRDGSDKHEQMEELTPSTRTSMPTTVDIIPALTRADAASSNASGVPAESRDKIALAIEATRSHGVGSVLVVDNNSAQGSGDMKNGTNFEIYDGPQTNHTIVIHNPIINIYLTAVVDPHGIGSAKRARAIDTEHVESEGMTWTFPDHVFKLDANNVDQW